MNSAPTRRSGRQRVPNRRYADDIVEELHLSLSSDDDAAEPVPQEEYRTRSPEDDEDFDFEQEADEPESSNGGGSSVEEASEGSTIAIPHESDNEIVDDIANSDTELPKRQNKIKPSSDVHSRGVSEKKLHITHRSERTFLAAFIGEDRGDESIFLRNRDKWANNVTLPTQNPDRSGLFGGMSWPFNHTSKQRRMEATVGWDWYYLGDGKALFDTNQTTRALSSSEGSHYLSQASSDNFNLLMGPYGTQKLFSLPFLQSLNINEAWSQAYAVSSTNDDEPGAQTQKKRQDGWTLNLGGSVQCLEWAPNNPGNTQFIAISTFLSSTSKSEDLPKGAPAYTPRPGPSCLQLWKIAVGDQLGLDDTPAPELCLLFCHSWGNAKQFHWCQVPHERGEQEPTSLTRLGLLAGVWADGHVRVLDVCLDDQSTSRNIFIESAAFCAKPANAICTCVTWLSPTDIAVGCSNGYVAIWNIHTSTDQPQSNSRGMISEPYFYEPLHQSYVLAIASAYPTHPHMICTSAMSGYMRLTDIRSPTSDYVLSQRVHWNPSTICYCGALSSFITYDEGGLVKLHPLRRFWTQINFARGDAEVTSLAVGHLHTSVLIGFADGTLLAANPARRFVGARHQLVLQQKVWKHEWARRKATTNDCANAEAPDQSNQSNRIERISRVTEGYKIDLAVLRPKATGEHRRQVTKTQAYMPVYTTIYDAETAVRTVAWNPNEGCGGWLLQGWEVDLFA